VGIFTKGDSESSEPSPKPVAPPTPTRGGRSSGRKSTRSTQYVANTRIPQPASAIRNVFLSEAATSSVPYNHPRTMTAAAAQIRINDKSEFEQFKTRRSASSSAWQAEAWEYYDAIGEIKYAFNLVASVVSRIRIFAAAVDDPSQAAVSVHESRSIEPDLAAAADRALERLSSAYGGQAGLLKDAALNLSVAGECYLVQFPALRGSGTPESWDIRSVDEVIPDSRGSFSVAGRREQIGGAGASNSSGMLPLPKTTFIGRIWRSHPRFSDEADSSLRGLLDMCLAEGTLVYTPRGAVPIENVSAGDLVYSRNPDSGELVQSMASRVWSTGVKPVYKVSSRGRSIRATGNHPVLVLRDSNPATKKGVSAKYELSYVRVDELSKGDMLISFETAGTPVYDMQVLPSGVEINEDVAWFIGQVTGDGHIHRGKYTKNCLNVADFDPIVRSRLVQIAQDYWNADHFFHQGGNFRVKSEALTSDMRSLGLGVYSYEKTVPELIWASPTDVQKSFLLGYFEADGSGGAKSKGYHSYSSASFSLVSQVRAMHIMHGDRVSSVQTQERPEVMYIAGNTRPTLNAKALHRFEMYGNTSNRRGDLPMRRNKSARELLSLDQPFVVSSVKSIVPDGEATVWDMTVPDTENFIADGLVVHNCAELLLLNRTFRATARSRLNAGALYLPDGLSVAAQGDPDYPFDSEDGVGTSFTAEEAEDEFEEQLMDAMTTPIRDEESASAVVPLIIRGPAELGDAIKQFKFERSFDPALAERSDRVLERILQGLDVPKDVVTGLANVKYSNALQIDEALYKAHIEPLMLLIVDALTVVYLRPYLIASGYPEVDVNRLTVWYDPSAVATRNDRAADADAGFDRGAISLDTWRRAHGFSDQDAPTPNELALRMLQERGVITPELTEALLAVVAPEVMDAVRGASQASSAGPIPPEVEQILQQATGGQGAPASAPEPSAPVPAPDPEPAPEATPPPGAQQGDEPPGVGIPDA